MPQLYSVQCTLAAGCDRIFQKRCQNNPSTVWDALEHRKSVSEWGLELKFLDFLAMILFLLPHRDKVTFERGEFQNTGRTIDPAGIGSRDRVFGPATGQPERGVRHRVPSNNCCGRIVYRRIASGGRVDISAG